MFNTKDKFSLDVFVVNGWQKQVGPWSFLLGCYGHSSDSDVGTAAFSSSSSTAPHTASHAADSPRQQTLQGLQHTVPLSPCPGLSPTLSHTAQVHYFSRSPTPSASTQHPARATASSASHSLSPSCMSCPIPAGAHTLNSTQGTSAASNPKPAGIRVLLAVMRPS